MPCITTTIMINFLVCSSTLLLCSEHSIVTTHSVKDVFPTHLVNIYQPPKIFPFIWNSLIKFVIDYNSFVFSVKDFISTLKVINFKVIIIIIFLCLYCLCICMAAYVFVFVHCCICMCAPVGKNGSVEYCEDKQ